MILDLLYSRKPEAIEKKSKKFIEKYLKYKAQTEEVKRIKNDANKENLQPIPTYNILYSYKDQVLNCALKLYNTHRSIYSNITIRTLAR